MRSHGFVGVTLPAEAARVDRDRGAVRASGGLHFGSWRLVENAGQEKNIRKMHTQKYTQVTQVNLFESVEL